MNRRRFLQAAPAAAALGVLPPAGAAAKDDSRLKLSVLAYSFHGLLREGKMDIFGFMETCKYRYHLDAADLWNGFLTSTDEAYLKKVREALDERELVVPNLAVDQAHIWVDDPAEREKNYRHALANLNAGRILGARFVRIDAGGGSKDKEWSPQAFDHIVKRYREYAQYAQENGFKAGAEVHWGPEGYWSNLQKLHRAVNHPAFGICLHISGFQGSQEEKDRGDREIAPWVLHTHIPWNITEGPLVEKMNTLRDAGYQGYYSVEHHTAKAEYAEVAVQLARVRAVLESWRTGGSGKDSYASRPPRP